VDQDYVKTMGMKIIAGRNFTERLLPIRKPLSSIKPLPIN